MLATDQSLSRARSKLTGRKTSERQLDYIPSSHFQSDAGQLAAEQPNDRPSCKSQ